MKLRAHHLICIIGFRGLGYSKEYVDNMTKIVVQLRSSPETLIEIAGKPDDICSPCPFLGDKGCQERGLESEEVVRNRDLAVTGRLNMVVGDRITWAEAEERIRSSISPEDLDKICQDCQWLPLGYCVAGLKRLKNLG
ncbi:MAG: DUF1284 domain-containing protein [Dehalococcoidia bacterium]|nr:DUF1284 domain-containing protein [Dehalococcoidia bacterium]